MTTLTAVQVGAGWFSESAAGLDRYYHDLIGALPEAGVRCRALVVGSGAVDEETDGSVQAFARPDDPLLRRWRNARTAVARHWQAAPEGAKVLVTHFALYAYPLIKDRKGRPWVMHFHGPWDAGLPADAAGGVRGWVRRRLETSVYQKADRVIVLSGASRDVLCGTYGVDPQRVDVIPGGIDLDRFAPTADITRADARRQFGWPADRPTVLSVRPLTDKMGLDPLVDAMKVVRHKVPNALCVIAGRGPLAGPLVTRIEAAGLADAVTLLGFVPDEDLPLAYRAADVTILPSEVPEGFGVSAAESLAAGTPVFVTPTDGLPEIVHGLEPNLVLADASADAMAAALTKALTDPTTLPSAEACRAYAARTFDWQVVAARVAAVYASTAVRAD